tara:strand:- start:1261 stop:1743 length:483 start_codon:yes stop_codon:yes gene_type:complete
MDEYLLQNRCTKIRVSTSDEHTLKVFSVFYQHPALIDPEGWTVLKTEENILVDKNTMWILEKHECEFGYEAKSGTILTCRIKPKDCSNLEAHWDDILQYCMEVKGDFAKFCDEDISLKMDNLKLKSDSKPGCSDPEANDRKLDSTLPVKEQTLPKKLSAD